MKTGRNCWEGKKEAEKEVMTADEERKKRHRRRRGKKENRRTTKKDEGKKTCEDETKLVGKKEISREGNYGRRCEERKKKRKESEGRKKENIRRTIKGMKE